MMTTKRLLFILMALISIVSIVGVAQADTPTLTTINKQVGASADDAGYSNSNSPAWSTKTPDVLIGYDAKVKSGVRFTGITIPKGAKIMAAYLSFKASEADRSSTVNCRIWGENVANPATYSTLTNFNARIKTRASVDWNRIGTWAANTWYNSPSLVTVVQELVNARGYSNGSMSFILNNLNSTARSMRAYRQYDDSPSQAAKLHIEYTTVTPPTTPTPTPTPSSGIWKPTPAAPIHWQWQIGTPFDPSRHFLPNVTVYDIDMFDNSAGVVAAIHAKGPQYKAIAYISFGSYEDWRPDASQFPASVIGNKIDGWSDRWLDIRAPEVKTIMTARISLAKSKGFDAIEPDCIEAYNNNSGFPITAADQIAYNRWVADACHAAGLSVGLKGDTEQVTQLQPYFDWCLNEECYQYHECDGLLSFIKANKAVFQVEYTATGQCSWMNSNHINSMRRNLDLTAGGTRTPCIPDSQNTWN